MIRWRFSPCFFSATSVVDLFMEPQGYLERCSTTHAATGMLRPFPRSL